MAMDLSPDLLKQMNNNIVPNNVYYSPVSDFKSAQPLLSKGQLNLFVYNSIQSTNMNAMDARDRLCIEIGKNNKLDEQDYLLTKQLNESENSFQNDDNNDDDYSLHRSLETSHLTNLTTIEEPAFKILQSHREGLDASIKLSATLELVGFIVKCVDTIENAKSVLYSDVVSFITENKENLCDFKDWECMFNLLFTQFYKYKEAGLIIYRNGLFVGKLIETYLTDEENKSSVRKLNSIRQSCRRTVSQVKECILEVFECCRLETVPYAFISKAQHELLSTSQKMKSLISNFGCENWMENLKTAASKDCKLKLLVVSRPHHILLVNSSYFVGRKNPRQKNFKPLPITRNLLPLNWKIGLKRNFRRKKK
jgi:hypothetical protein